MSTLLPSLTCALCITVLKVSRPKSQNILMFIIDEVLTKLLQIFGSHAYISHPRENCVLAKCKFCACLTFPVITQFCDGVQYLHHLAVFVTCMQTLPSVCDLLCSVCFLVVTAVQYVYVST